MLRKIIASSVLLVASVGFTYADVVEIDCSTDPVFSEYSCNQCFNWGAKVQWDFIGLMTDIWDNTSEHDKFMFKAIQKMPEMRNLNTDAVEWSQVPNSEDFWEYTSELEALYDADLDGYILPAGAQVKWLQSKLDAAYKLNKNEVEKDWNVWLLVYSLTSGNILEWGELSTDFSEHNECVLYTSWDEEKKPAPTTLPQTGPAEFFLLLILAMVLGFGIVKFRNSNS